MSSSELSDWASEDDQPLLKRPVFKSKIEEKEWERKQRNREYRVASRREKRNRKADEKKQRKLNATILRRMTKNPEKYNKNADRNRQRDIEIERRRIYREAVLQAERLAAIHDPSGKMFNVGPVVIGEDGKVVSVEYLERRARTQAEKAAKHAQSDSAGQAADPAWRVENSDTIQVPPATGNNVQDRSNLEDRHLTHNADPRLKGLSKTQQKKRALLEGRPPPPKPVLPEGIELPDGEENWIALWDLSENALEQRVIRERKRKAGERKALREKQKSGKVERRAARDERRRVYREKKLEWKAIKAAENQRKTKLLRVEQEESKRIEVDVNLAERRKAMEICAELGFTLQNVEGLDEIKPKMLGMKGQEIDFSVIEIGDRPSEIKINDDKLTMREKSNGKDSKRVNLGAVVDDSKAHFLTGDGDYPAGLEGDFVSLNFGGGLPGGEEHEQLSYNHKLRRKLHRAIEAAQVRKELLVRTTAKEHCIANGIPIPPELADDYKPIKIIGRRMLEDGTVETAKQERVRKRLELAEYNKAARVLRQQAKAEATEAGLRVFAQLTNKKALTTIKKEDLADSGVSNNAQDDEAESLQSKKRRHNGDETDKTKSKRSKKSAA